MFIYSYKWKKAEFENLNERNSSRCWRHENQADPKSSNLDSVVTDNRKSDTEI